MLSVCFRFQFLDQLIDFRITWYKCYTTGRRPTLYILNFLPSVIVPGMTGGCANFRGWSDTRAS
jgi:hypothetical protein